jgi:membrane protein
MKRLIEIGLRLPKLYRKEIWSSSHLKDNSPRGWLYAALRVTSITWTVFNETKIPARAAALSFGSLLGLAPLVAIAVLIGGFVLGKDTDPSLIANRLAELMEQVAPQLRQLNSLDAAGNPTSTTASPEVVKVISDIIAAARSGVAGAAGGGVFSLILIVLLLFKSIEDAFNDIWGVRLGRSLLMRIVFYWTTLTLGAVLFFSILTLLGVSAAVNVFQQPPGGSDLQALLRWMLPAFALPLLVGFLTLVYRVIPNTHVFWRAAFVGAVVVAALLLLNNVVALLYVKRVVLERSLYGSLAIFPVFMLGLYIFWLYVLIGGVISYAVQNVHFRNSQAAWGSLSESMRERLSLVVLLTIGRRFQNCLPATSAAQLGDMLKVPTQVLNECLNRLVQMELITTLRPTPGTPATEYLYQPARPLNRISLNEFKNLDDNFGDDPIGQALEQIDPILHHYNDALERLGHQSFFKKSLEELFLEHPFKDSKPSLTTGNRP